MRPVAVAVSACLTILPAPVLSQSQTEAPTGSRVLRPKPADIPDGKMAPVDQARETAAQFGECVVRMNRSGALRTLAYFPSDPLAGKALGRLAISECLRSGELRMPYAAMRGALFIGLYRRDYGRVLPPMPAEKVDFSLGLTARDDAANAAIALREFVDCAVRADPADARMTILAPVASRTESAAYAGLAPHLNACLPQGVNAKFSKTILSGLIAEVAYRNAGALPARNAN